MAPAPEIFRMSVPGLVEAALGDESVAATVDLGGDDALFVSPTRTLVYRSEGLLSDESIEEYSHDAERVSLSEGRRKCSIELDYGLDGTKTLTIPRGRLDEVLHSILAGVLNAVGVTDPGETVLETFRFSDLTVVISSDRVVKHIGSAIWDEDYEEYHYDDVIGLDFEQGSVAMTVVLTTADRQERFKAPNQEARAVKERLEAAVLEYHGVGSVEELGPAEPIEPEPDPGTGDGIGFGGSVDPLVEYDDETGGHAEPDPHNSSTTAAVGSGDSESSDDPGSPMADAGFEPATMSAEGDVVERIEALEAAVERQSALLEQLIGELRQRDR